MPVDVIIDPSSGQIYWNDAAGSGTQTIAISGNATNAINIVGYSNFFSPGGGGLGTQILATFTDSATSTFTPGTNAYDLGSSSLRWNFYGTGGNFTGAISTSSTTASTSSTTGALTVTGGAGIAKTSYFGQDVKIQGSTASTTPTTGALTVAGGVGISGKLIVGTATTGDFESMATFSGTSTASNLVIKNYAGSILSTTGLYLLDHLENRGSISLYSANWIDQRKYALELYTGLGDIRFLTDASNKSHIFEGGIGVTILQTTVSTSTSTGALKVAGGAGIALTSYFGQDVKIQGTTASGSTTTGALTVSGGVGIGGSLNVFGTIDVANNIEVLSQKEVRFFNSANTFYTGLRAGSSSANVTFTLPVADGTANQVLYTNGSAGLAWTSLASVSAITSLNGLTASTQTFATGTSGTDFNISSGTSTHTFNIPYAGSGATGLVTTQAQTIAGAKTFSSQTIISDTTVSSSAATGALLVYGGLGVTGQINAASLQTSGNAVISGNLTFNGVGVFGNATSDTINSLARYISDILPSTDNSYDLGNNSLGWRNFRVSGVGTIASLAVTSSTASTNTTTGALRVSGGAGIALTSYFGQDVKIQGSTASTTPTTGALTVAGGVGISGRLYIGEPIGFQSQIGIGGSNCQIILKNTYGGPDTKQSGLVIFNDADQMAGFLYGQSYDAIPDILVIFNPGDIQYSSYGTNSTHQFSSPLDLELTIGGTGVSVLRSTASTSTTTGGLTVSGGAGIALTSFFGQDVKIQGTTASTSTSTGALVVTGGVGIGGSLWTSTSNLASVSGVTLNNGTITGTLSGTATSAQVLATTTDTSSTLYLLGSRSSTGFAGTTVYVDTNISFSGSTITASLTGTATTATAAIGVNVSNAATNSTHYIRFSPTATGTGLATSTNTSLTYNPSTNILSATTFSGSFSGSLTGTASIATSSVNSATTTDTTSTLYLLGSRSSTGFAGTALYVDSSISILGSQITAGVWGGTAISAVNGGTGQVSYTVGDLLYASSTTALSKLAAGTAGSVLKSNGAGTAPSWQVDSTGSGGAGTVATPSASNLIAYYPGTGASVASTPFVSIESANSAVEISSQNSKSALILNAANGSVVNLAEFKGPFGDTFWAFGTTGQELKGANGQLKLNSASYISLVSPATVRFYNTAETFYTAITGSTTVSSNVTYTLPPTAPATGTSVLQSSTGGTLSWVAMTAGSGSGTVTSGTAGSIAYYTGTGTTVGGSPGFTYTTSGTASTINVFGGSAIGTTIFTVQATSATSVRVGIGTNLPQYELEIVGELSATNKSFVIDHPTKPGKKLRYGSLEGPENGVYVRGELKDSNIIETPDHWIGLVYPDSFTVTLTPIGRFSYLYVEKIEDYKVFIADAYMNPIHCYYTVWAERKDIPKLVTEY